MFGLNLIAVILGLSAAVVLNGVAGIALGLAIATDANAHTEHELEAHFKSETASRSLMIQLAILSLVIALLSGALTAWYAPGAPFLNAGFVGLIGMAIGLALPSPGFPKAAQKWLARAHLPAALAGAWALLHFGA
ncbi:MAG TPA: hypothetical protein ENK83_01675 [Aliiroseovarius sp.]|nr:hypothetical protein [Aliiroseovarius sp.]